MNRRLCLVALTLGAGALLGQGAALTRRATPSGKGGDGKCTIEVEVDDAAEVEVSGDVGVLRTLEGRTAVWRRFECNGPLPSNPGDFRFRGIDGRGNVYLVRDPRSSRGRAVVRIEDPKGGREGYTFDLEWRGSTGGVWRDDDGPPPLGRYGGGRDGGAYSPASRAIRICEEAVVSRIRRDGYRFVNFERIEPDNNPGRNDWVVGTVIGQRGRNATRLRFACSVDFRSGRVRSVDVRR